MKKIILFFVVVLCIAHLVNAQLKLYVYENDGEVSAFVASEVDSISFTAPSDYLIEPNDIDSFEYVDMGLSVRWGTCNVGAATPEEYGYYFAWGEVETKEYYQLNNYRWAASVSGMILKYCTNSFLGNVDNKTQLEPEDDAAHVICEDMWRIPTEYEFNELINNCSITWTSSNGVYGLEFVSNKNGNSIFIPAAGYYYDVEKDASYFGYYWTSSLDINDSTKARQFAFNEDGHNLSSSTRYFGQTIRPVLP
jgi:uncharacterized protein (TIGR02145 family)